MELKYSSVSESSPFKFYFFTGPNQLKIAANLIPLVYVVHFVFFPIAYPISLFLDCWLGHDEGVTVYNRKEIAAMMNIQHEEVRQIMCVSMEVLCNAAL